VELGERFRSDATRQISRFLDHHQGCDAGFDVRRQGEPGHGQFAITCLGCGQTVEYRAAHLGDLVAVDTELEAAAVENGGGSGPPENEGAPRSEGRSEPRARRRLPPLLIVGCAFAAIVLIAVVLLGD
jgi:hypothetical protein